MPLLTCRQVRYALHRFPFNLMTSDSGKITGRSYFPCGAIFTQERLPSSEIRSCHAHLSIPQLLRVAVHIKEDKLCRRGCYPKPQVAETLGARQLAMEVRTNETQ